MIYANADIDPRSFLKVEKKSRRVCQCGCAMRATHIGLAGGIGMVVGCELSIRRWAKKMRSVNK